MASRSPRLYKQVNLADLTFAPLEKEGRSYVVRLDPPLVLQTPALVLATPLAEGASPDEASPFVYVQPAGGFAEFLKTAEDTLLRKCLENKKEWLRKDIEDDVLEASFKSLFRPAGFRLKVSQDVEVFDASRNPTTPAAFQAGTSAKCILVLKQLTFGKTEFGGIWRLIQAQAVPQPTCLIRDSECGDSESDADSEAQEFL